MSDWKMDFTVNCFYEHSAYEHHWHIGSVGHQHTDTQAHSLYRLGHRLIY